jgi:hypothetical protein
MSSSYKQRLSSLGGSSPSGTAYNIIETVLDLYGHLPLPEMIEALTRDAARTAAVRSAKALHEQHVRSTLKVVSSNAGSACGAAKTTHDDV